MRTQRHVWFTDRYGAGGDDDVSLARFSQLLDTIKEDDGDNEHRSISVSDENEWNLEFYPGSVLFENVGEDGGEVGTLFGLSDSDLLSLAQQFIDGHLEAVRAWNWS